MHFANTLSNSFELWNAMGGFAKSSLNGEMTRNTGLQNSS